MNLMNETLDTKYKEVLYTLVECDREHLLAQEMIKMSKQFAVHLCDELMFQLKIDEIEVEEE